MNNENNVLPDNPSIQVLKAGQSGIFTNYIYKAIPLAFDESMSYYETLLGLLNYLQNVILPTVNNNADAVAELQNLYIELKTYVDDYFTNLDVQEEINNKLDAMVEDGSLTLLIKNYVDPIYQEYENSINARVNEIDTKVDSVASGSPLVASSTDGMTDTTRVYVNTTDGKWYYYNGTAWQIGGTYQSTGIAEGSITYKELDENLNGLFIKNIDLIEKGNATENYKIVKNGTTIDIVSDTNYDFYKIDISSYIGKLLYYAVGTFTNMYSIIITDNSDQIITTSPINNTQTSFLHQNGNIPIVNNMKWLYLTQNKYRLTNELSYQIGIYKDFTNNFNYDETSLLTPLKYIESWYCDSRYSTVDANPYYTNLNDFTVNLYKAYKGAKYKITGKNYQNAVAFLLTDDNEVIYTSSHDLYELNTQFEYEFICQKDGYIITTISPSNNMNVNVYMYNKISSVDIASENNAGIVKVGNTLEIENDGTLNINTSTYLSDYKVGFTGDSICAGNGYNGGYAKILHDTYGLQIQNIGVSGGHITDDEITPFVISNSIDDLDDDCDAYIIEGGINDYGNGVPFGEMTGAFTSSINQQTFCGALEKICRDLYTYHPGKHYAFLIVHSVLISYYDKVNGKTFMDFRNAIYDICNKYSVDVIDIAKNESMLTYYEDIREDYTMQYQGNGDGLHPNQAGYTKFYIPEIKAWLDKIFKL